MAPAGSGAYRRVDQRGGAPGTCETDLLRPMHLVQHVHAVVLAGGSVFGLAAADGVMRYLRERGVGYDTGVARVPICPAAILFDLAVGSPDAFPDAEMGYTACLAATAAPVAEGRIGVGNRLHRRQSVRQRRCKLDGAWQRSVGAGRGSCGRRAHRRESVRRRCGRGGSVSWRARAHPMAASPTRWR